MTRPHRYCAVLLTLPGAPLRTASFGLEGRWLLWSRVRVYPDWLEMAGWSLAGRHRWHISLDRIEDIGHETKTAFQNVCTYRYRNWLI